VHRLQSVVEPAPACMYVKVGGPFSSSPRELKRRSTSTRILIRATAPGPPSTGSALGRSAAPTWREHLKSLGYRFERYEDYDRVCCEKWLTPQELDRLAVDTSGMRCR
jgi:hypothetical protein